MKKTFSSLHARTICHATEVTERVRHAMMHVVGDAELREYRTEGHFGNPIIIVEASVEDPRTIDEIFQRFDRELTAELLGSLDRRIDDGCNLFIKLDKQAAFEGRAVMARDDDVVSVRAKVSAYPAKCGVARSMIEKYLTSEGR